MFSFFKKKKKAPTFEIDSPKISLTPNTVDFISILEKFEINGEIVKNNIISAFNSKIQKGENVELNQIYPVYLRASQAEIEREKKKNNG